MHALRLTLVVFAILSLPWPWAEASSPAAKLDDQLGDNDKHVAIFVRMDDQLFAAGGEFEKFCDQQLPTIKRLELRNQIISQLQSKAAKSFESLRAEVERLESAGAVRKLQRYWIVNGFACQATGGACRALAAIENVDFVYRQRFAPQHQTRQAKRTEADDESTKLYRKVLAELSDDSVQPFEASQCEVPWNLQRIRADRAWSAAKGKPASTGRGVVVAVLDSGMMPAAALIPALWTNSDETLNGKDDDGNGYVDDVFGFDFDRNLPLPVAKIRPPHGTLCAGIIAGRPNGHQRDRPIVTGVAPRAKIMPLVGFGQLRAYEYALDNGADILSMSYTWDSQKLGHYRGLIRTAHEHLAAAGVVSVGGAGNYARSRPAGWQIGTPKDIPCVIAAAGITQNGNVSQASSRGPVSWKGVRYFSSENTTALSKPDVTGCFGGYPMWTHIDAWQPARRNRVAQVVHTDSAGFVLAIGPRGNSFSGPHAAGVAALMLAANPDLPAWHLKRLMESACGDFGEPGPDTTFGAGLLNADKAVEAAIAFGAE